ncbi:permease for cytosine/purine, uracil, thiamine, allantoin [Vulcanisaeta moutnovskia 768-28]|uniref:Permease for cytosine/purine, uracil, thiamine, allantoin n=2 Tax=Vulcanisaeta TaxID=164450 RepID=F0QY09_VULM7|nr:permease for cytosine/purine, uracil, thiamine, allantoin [Vulcanisaeta moutnovskia 768-28]
MLIAITLAFILGVIPTLLFSEMGRQIPLTALVIARKTFGYGTAQALSLLYTVINIGWFALNNAVGSEILSAVTHTPIMYWYIIMGTIQIFLVILGFKWLEYFYRYTSIILLISYAVLTYYLIIHYHVSWSTLWSTTSSANAQWGAAIDLMLAFGALSWAYKTSTTSRFAKPSGKVNILYGLATPIGIIVPIYLMGILGFAGQYYANNWNIAAISFPPSTPAWVLIAALGASLAIIHTNAMNLYPSAIDLLVAIDPVIRRFRNEFRARLTQPVAILILGIAAIIVSIWILSIIESFLNFVGLTIFPLTFILIFDWYLRLKRNVHTLDDVKRYFYDIPREPLRHIGIAAIVSFIIGSVLMNYLPIAIPTTFPKYLPPEYTGALIGGLVYLILMLLAIKVKKLSWLLP